jgi:hypothetical protein
MPYQQWIARSPTGDLWQVSAPDLVTATKLCSSNGVKNAQLYKVTELYPTSFVPLFTGELKMSYVVKSAGASIVSHSHIFAAAGIGISWANILTWIETYGFSLLIQVLDSILPNIGGLTLTQIISWIEAALVALASGGTLPPFPVVVPQPPNPL